MVPSSKVIFLKNVNFLHLWPQEKLAIYNWVYVDGFLYSSETLLASLYFSS